jgi:hypothetical protein
MSPLQLATIWSMAASFGLEVIENPSTFPCDKLLAPTSVPVDNVDRSDDTVLIERTRYMAKVPIVFI